MDRGQHRPPCAMLGTDYPCEMGDPDPVATIEAIPGLGTADRTAILSGNAQRLLAGIG